MKRTICITALGLSLFAIEPAFGADGYVIGNVNLRAGPDTSYPSVVMLPAGTEVAIAGCVDGWSWCDVEAGNDRGWVAGNFLQEEYRGQRVLVPDYGVQIGIPVVSFVFGTYWDDHYRNRSWYRNREHWSRMTPRYSPTGMHGSRHDNMHEDTNPHSRNTTVDAYRAHEPSAVAPSSQHASGATHSAHQGKPSRSAAPRHDVANETRSGGQHPLEHGAVPPRAVAGQNAPRRETGVEHKAAHHPAAKHGAPEKKDDHGKDEH